MQEAEEQDTCRICSFPSEPGQPLFYPCKCSGTIRYIHQDCLTTWLSHSKKKTCDVCKHPYTFTKVYASDMPPSLPPLLLVRRLAQQAFFATLFGIRAIVIAFIWLALLPWITIWTWRVYFTMGESTAWWISGRERPPDLQTIGFVPTLTVSNETVSSFRNATVLQRFSSRGFWQALSSDIFAGQIIASLIVLVFVAIFLLREWISQNARPGVFEEDEIAGAPPQDPPIPIAPPNPALQGRDANARLLVPQGRDALDLQLEAHRQERPFRPHRPLPANARVEVPQRHLQDQDEHLEFRNPVRRPQNPRVEPLLIPPLPTVLPPVALADLGDMADNDEREEREEVDIDSVPAVSDVRRRVRRRYEDGDDGDGGGGGGNESAEPAVVAGPSLFSASDSVPVPSPPLEPESGRSSAIELSPFEFTFRVPANGKSEEDIREPVPEMPAPSLIALQTAVMTGAPIPEEEPRRRSIVFPPDLPRASTPHSTTPVVEDETNAKPSLESSLTSSSDLSFVHLSMSNRSVSPAGDLASSSIQDATSLEHPTTQSTFTSPSEALAAGSSGLPAENMDRRKRSRDEMEEEYNHYFREPRPVSPNTVDAHNDAANAPRDAPRAPEEDHVAENDRGQHMEVDPDDEDDSEDEDVPEQVFWDADADREDEEDDDEDLVDLPDFNVANNRQGARPPPQVQGPAEQVNDGVDDLEAAVEDDMEGALEAIGLRGPIFGVVQNVILMIFVLDTAIGFGVWLPFTLGKTTALLSLDPQRALFILHLPIRGMRIVTDPFVDVISFVLGRFLFPFFYKASALVLSNVLGLVSYFPGDLTPQSTVSFQSRDISLWVSSKRSELAALASQWWQTSPQQPPTDLAQKINDFFESNSTVAQLLEPRFAYVGREVRLFTHQFQQSWVNLTLGHGSGERAFAILLGYGVIGIILALYLNVFTVGNARTAGRAVRNAIRQQLLVVKVAMFIIIELVIFPLGCGIMLDACTIWVFPEASLQSRVAFFTQAPLTAMFYHWVAGTMFMYQFAVLLGGCRNIMRPGAMWFIKDPQDQNYHPIRDILDRPTLTQFRKLLISAFMYAMVVVCGVGSLAILLFIGNRSIFPIRWKTRQPLSEVPIDLLFLQIVLPYTMRYLRPRKAVYRVAVHVWKFLAAKLRLTSYMFGDRHREEESSRVYKGWVAFFRRSAEDHEEVLVTRDGSFRRVPASDNIALPRDMRATAEVHEDGSPLNDRAAALMAAQNEEAIKAKRDIKGDYIVVYFPPQFRMRIVTFVMAVWTIMAITAAICVAVPVQVGRQFFALISPSTVHDGYSFLGGFYILWGCYLVAKAADSMDRHRQRIARDGPRADFAVYFAKQSLLWAIKMGYMVVFLGVVIPILVALVVDVYIVLPVRLTFHPTMIPTIRLVNMWSLGLVYCKIFIKLRRRLQLPQRRHEALHVLLSNGWTHPDPRHATEQIILPLLANLLGALLLPAGAVYILREMFHVPLDKRFLFVHAYPGIFAVVAFSRSVMSGMALLSTWSQSIRDKEFLVEMRLQNFEGGSPDSRTGERKVVQPESERVEEQ